MKIMVIGAAGFVGSYLVEECLKNSDDVIGTIRWNEDLNRLNKEIKTEYVELTDLSSVIRAINKHRPDVISHLAAQSWPPYSMECPTWTIESNTIGTLNILEAVRIIQEIDNRHLPINMKKILNKQKLTYDPLIHICSSSEFYGKVNDNEVPITENTRAGPGNIYGVGKVGADFSAQLYAKYYDMNILITRMFTHTGAKRTMMSAENYYAREVARREIDGDNIIRIGDEAAMNSKRTWADVRDAVKNYRELFKNEKTGIYNISGQTVKTIKETLEELIRLSNLEYEKMNFIVDEKFIRKVNVDNQVVDISKFKQDNEWSNEISFEELMKSLLDYWREHERTN